MDKYFIKFYFHYDDYCKMPKDRKQYMAFIVFLMKNKEIGLRLNTDIRVVPNSVIYGRYGFLRKFGEGKKRKEFNNIEFRNWIKYFFSNCDRSIVVNTNISTLEKYDNNIIYEGSKEIVTLDIQTFREWILDIVTEIYNRDRSKECRDKLIDFINKLD